MGTGKLTDEDRCGLVRANLPWAYGIASRYCGAVRSCLHKDLRQSAVLGLIEASRRYNPSLPNAAAFTTYSRYWIVRSIYRFLDSTPWGPVATRPEGAIAHRALLKGRGQRNARAARAYELARTGTISLDELSPDAAGSLTATNDPAADPVECSSARELATAISDAIESLPITPKARQIFVRHFGLDGGRPEDFAALGRRFGMTLEGARQNILRICGKLRESDLASRF